MINSLKGDYSTRLLCETLGVHRCKLYREPRPDENRPILRTPSPHGDAPARGIGGQRETSTAVDARSEELRRSREA
jgi:hypothetical protein